MWMILPRSLAEKGRHQSQQVDGERLVGLGELECVSGRGGITCGEQTVMQETEGTAEFSKRSGGDGPGVRRGPQKGWGYTLSPRGGRQDGWVESGAAHAAGLSGAWAVGLSSTRGSGRWGRLWRGRAREPGGEV